MNLREQEGFENSTRSMSETVRFPATQEMGDSLRAKVTSWVRRHLSILDGIQRFMILDGKKPHIFTFHQPLREL